MSRTFRRVNKYVPYATISFIKRLKNYDNMNYFAGYKSYHCVYDLETALSMYRDGFNMRSYCHNSNPKDDIYKSREKAYYKRMLVNCMKSDEQEYLFEDVRKKHRGLTDYW